VQFGEKDMSMENKIYWLIDWYFIIFPHRGFSKTIT
jgi:hypothetical protein